ncbi:hypothetical protein FKM82_011587 [Ascaphus truei]
MGQQQKLPLSFFFPSQNPEHTSNVLNCDSFHNAQSVCAGVNVSGKSAIQKTHFPFRKMYLCLDTAHGSSQRDIESLKTFFLSSLSNKHSILYNDAGYCMTNVNINSALKNHAVP